MSEKTYTLSESRTYVFVVPGDANKLTVAAAVTAQFDVKVADVNIANVKGKAKRTVSKSGRRVKNGQRNDMKKAFVTLQEGQSIPIFAADEETEAKQEKVQTQVDKAAAKQAEKDAKAAAKAAKKENK
jgi:large subunit ribosomal protein L23